MSNLDTAQKILRERIAHEKKLKANNARAAEFNRAVRLANWRIKVDHKRP